MKRVRALTLIALVTSWLMPAGGSPCPSTAHSTDVAHVYANREAGHAHDPGARDHHHAEKHAAGRRADSLADDSTCCERRASDDFGVRVALQDAQPQPKLHPVLPTPIALAISPADATSGKELRHQPPPRGPYARTRRPLLI